MKKLITVSIFLFLSNICYSQRLNVDSLDRYDLQYIIDEIKNTQKYSVDECKVFGETLAKIDIAKGIKRILKSYGAFDNGYVRCFFEQKGIHVQSVVSDCIKWKTIDAFINAYNQMTESYYGIIFKPVDLESDVFITSMWHEFNVDARYKSGNTIIFKLSSEKLEDLFNEDLFFLRIILSIDSVTNDKHIITYQELKNDGFEIKYQSKKNIKLFITFDFTDVPVKYEISWCKALDQKYDFMFPLTFK